MTQHHQSNTRSYTRCPSAYPSAPSNCWSKFNDSDPKPTDFHGSQCGTTRHYISSIILQEAHTMSTRHNVHKHGIVAYLRTTNWRFTLNPARTYLQHLGMMTNSPLPSLCRQHKSITLSTPDYTIDMVNEGHNVRLLNKPIILQHN